MRPVRLTMQAFGPYPGREVVDFRHAVEAGVFGIYGQTGSGKSTLFSAMTFALFGQASRSEQEAPTLRSDHADPGVATEVEFVFDMGEKRYVALRQPDQLRPKQRGSGETKSPHEAHLFDATGLTLEDITHDRRGRILAEKKVRDVDDAIRGLLGYGPEQFRQIVLLPQGRFETFLAAKTRDRLDILRELFDVSLYRNLAAHLKRQADEAEKRVSTERELCARRLAQEGFESAEALNIGITAVRQSQTELQNAEDATRSARDAAHQALTAGETLEGRFHEAEKAATALAALSKRQDAITALKEKVRQADRARVLLDLERHVQRTGEEAREAERFKAERTEAARIAAKEAIAAAETAVSEKARSGEIDALRRKADELNTYRAILANTVQESEAVSSAECKSAELRDKLVKVLAGLETLSKRRVSGLETLRTARLNEERRRAIAERLTVLQGALEKALAFDRSRKAVDAAQTAFDTLSGRYTKAEQRAREARETFENAERALSGAQALHLAAKLEDGSPCPVCGAQHHPDPVTGHIESAGLNDAFKETKAKWQTADEAARRTANELAVAKNTLELRQEDLRGLDVPEQSAEALREAVEQTSEAMNAHGDPADIPSAEEAIDQLSRRIEAGEAERERVRTALSESERDHASLKAALDARLSVIPDALREPKALTSESERIAKALSERQTRLEAAITAETQASRIAHGLEKEREAAETALTKCQAAHQEAQDTFLMRLTEAGFDQDAFDALKPAIRTIEDDRSRIEGFSRDLAVAEEAAKRTAEAVHDETRPDLNALKGRLTEAEAALASASERKSEAQQRVRHLQALRASLAETLKRLDEDEAHTGPLRRLAGLFDGKNALNLDLETFAIGAMFDQVLEAANLRLSPMTAGRYRLERDMDAGRGRRGLGLQIFDLFTGRARPTSTLSGGETFIAALALALGLADIVETTSGKVRLDTIFIDEGFGSLDTENGSGTLDLVLQVLNSLVIQNRAVGLISHVPLVQEAIPNGFYIRKGVGGSRVEARGFS
ncbi:exonuclease SbcC [Fulvimarina manganoxydans]|uniref:Exonuclease SbcC n=1 Tax=Fulvimarina manganoxydans TaxID=937218 RepID=A0A1W2BTM8_9HYPH|nr:SMC family ATPase [Fulvimarina manganoxydans]SMC76086.1 exonuclease SbcC [Fulvimarina manganoxydans]